MTKPKQFEADMFSDANVESARIIAADPTKYRGIMAEWAALILEREQAEAMPLFQGRAA